MDATSQTAAPRSTVLIVDDSPENLAVLGAVLQADYRVRVATDGRKALSIVESDEPPDLVLLDVMMPEMDGFEVCRRLKANPARSEVPVIFVSALSEVFDKVRAFGVGAVDYVTKPFQAEEVLARVATQCELRRRRAQLQESYDKLRRAESMRDSLVHMVIHDLRSPLAAIHAMLGLIKQDGAGRLSEESLEDVVQALAATKKMTLLINSLLDLSKMEAGKMALHCSPCDVGELAEKTLAGLKPLMGTRTLGLRLAPGRSTVVADAEMVARVLQNLFGNALKFAPGSSEIRVACEPREAALRVSVHDAGPGVPVEYREKIFEKFGQVEARAQNVASTGLGLTFCKLAVEAHGGRIGVDAEDGRYSTFWFELPYAGPAAGAAAHTGGEGR